MGKTAKATSAAAQRRRSSCGILLLQNNPNQVQETPGTIPPIEGALTVSRQKELRMR